MDKISTNSNMHNIINIKYLKSGLYFNEPVQNGLNNSKKSNETNELNETIESNESNETSESLKIDSSKIYKQDSNLQNKQSAK